MVTVGVDRAVAAGLVATEARDLALQAVNFAGEGVGSVFCRFGVRASADELGLFGLDLEDIAGVVFDQLGVLVLQLGDLGSQAHLVCAEV